MTISCRLCYSSGVYLRELEIDFKKKLTQIFSSLFLQHVIYFGDSRTLPTDTVVFLHVWGTALGSDGTNQWDTALLLESTEERQVKG